MREGEIGGGFTGGEVCWKVLLEMGKDFRGRYWGLGGLLKADTVDVWKAQYG